MISFNLLISNFHFVRPYWFAAILALLLVLWLLKKHRFYQSPWQQFLPNHLSQVLLEGNSTNNSSSTKRKSLYEHSFLIRPFIIGLLSIVALAGPVWQKLPQPVYQTERGSVLIMDMSYSMYATDVKPNRLTRARYKAVDLLNKINEGDTGLIAYAGDAFVISPLTQDIKNIELLLPSLTPEIMPELGANPLAALTLAHDMLLNAGHLNGDIYWFTDDVDNEEISDIFDWSNEYGHKLNILGIGSESGAPITLPSGELLKDHSGAIVVPRLPSQKLNSLAARGQGNYQTISNDDSDINRLIIKDKLREQNKTDQQQSQQTGDQWQEHGAWLLLLILPLLLSYFRRGGAVLLIPLTYLPLLLLSSLSILSSETYANDISASDKSSENATSTKQTSTMQQTWKNLWQTNDQQAQQHYNQENYQDAAAKFENMQWQGSSHYKAGNYQDALDAFKQGKQANTPNSLYNQGNALAQLQQYDKAIESYEHALEQVPDLQDAKDNIEKIKQLQKQQEQQQQQNDQSDQSQDDQQQSDKKDQDSQQQQEQNNNNQDSKENQEQQDSKGEQQEKDQQEKNQQQENQAENSDKEAEQQQEEQQKGEPPKEQDQAKQSEKKTPAQIAAEQQAKETEQKHQQLLNKVTDDPYLLLRNKMQLEYQKRKQDGSSQGVKKKW